MVRGCTEIKLLLHDFSCSAPFQSTHQAQGCVHQIPTFPLPYKITILSSKIPACPSPCFRSPMGFLSASWFSGWLSILGKKTKLQGRQREWQDMVYFPLSGKPGQWSEPSWLYERGDKGCCWHGECWEWGRQLQPCRAVSACLSGGWTIWRSKGGSGIYKSACACLCGSRVCIYYKEKLQMDNHPFWWLRPGSELIKISRNHSTYSGRFWPHLSLPFPNMPMTLRAVSCCIYSIQPCEQWGFPCFPECWLYRGSLGMLPSLLSHPAVTERQVLLIHLSLLKLLRGRCLIWFSKFASPGGFFSHLLYCFYLNTFQHHLTPQKPEFKTRKAHHPITFIQSITFLPALPELFLTCLHPFLKSLHSGFQISKADEPLV